MGPTLIQPITLFQTIQLIQQLSASRRAIAALDTAKGDAAKATGSAERHQQVGWLNGIVVVGRLSELATIA